jgi:hypothetical protein
MCKALETVGTELNNQKGIKRYDKHTKILWSHQNAEEAI